MIETAFNSLMPDQLLAFGMPGGHEWIILLVLGLLIFGRRFPEVGRSLGRGIVEFKKGIKGIEDEIEDTSSKPSLSSGSSSDPAKKLAEDAGAQGATQPRNMSEATVGGETANPYEARVEPSQEEIN